MNLRKLEKIIKAAFDIESKTKLNEDNRDRNLVYARHAFVLVGIYYGFEIENVMKHVGRKRCTCYNSIKQTVQLALLDKNYKRQLYDVYTEVKKIERRECKRKSNTYKRPGRRVGLMRCVVDAVL